MARTATSTIFIQASPTGLSVSTTSLVFLYANNVPINTLANLTNPTVQDLLNGVCIPSGVVPSSVNEIKVQIPDCNTDYYINLESVTTPTPTPTPTVGIITPTPTLTPRPVTNTPTPTPSIYTFYRTEPGDSGNDICCNPAALGEIYFSNVGFDGFPTFGSQAFKPIGTVFTGDDKYYGLSLFNNGTAVKYVQISNQGYVGANSSCPC